jgi:hypothetical protein
MSKETVSQGFRSSFDKKKTLALQSDTFSFFKIAPSSIFDIWLQSLNLSRVVVKSDFFISRKTK